MVKTLPDRNVRYYEHESQKPKRKPGRPRTGTAQSSYIGVSLKLLRQCHAALAAAENAQLPPNTAGLVGTALAGLTERLGPMLAPDWKPSPPEEAKRNASAWRVVLADGTEHLATTLAKAAALYGCKERSLAVMLSQGNGKCRRKAAYNGAESVIICERIR